MIINGSIPGFDADKDESLRILLEIVDGMERIEGCLKLTLVGYIDTYNSNSFQKRINLVLGAGFVRLIFDFGSLHYVSSTGIGSFTAFREAVKPRGGDLVLFGMQPKVFEVFQLLGFSQFFNIKDNIKDSINFFLTGVP